ncbi:hypothetical protein DY000_02006708 [Brassica cretica]|uniref:Uncharacterized protein n=1 Tax=Brassica cretica TaxID=69181 RepID=A0ABQ7CAD6_BRACR|nr:hypothetical protein DY000_02006708 [Brassica cretica]
MSVRHNWLVCKLHTAPTVDKKALPRLQPPEHLSSDLLHYADDPPGHAGLHCYLVQVSKVQPSLAAQYRSISGMEYRLMSDERCWSSECECCRSTVVSEYRSTELVSGSTVVEQNRATHKGCCRSMRSALPCRTNAIRIDRERLKNEVVEEVIDGKQARQESPKLDENPNFGIMKFSLKPKDREIFTAKKAEYLQKLEVWPCTKQEHSCSLTSGRSGGALHESWSCNQTCGARGAVAHASGAMRSDTRAATNLKLIAPREGSVQLKVNQVNISSDGKQVNVATERESERKWPVSSFDDQLEVLFRTSSVPRLDTPPRSPKNSPEAREGSTRVEFIPDQYQGRLFPSGDQSSPVKSSRPLGFGQVFSDQAAAYQHRTLRLGLTE